MENFGSFVLNTNPRIYGHSMLRPYRILTFYNNNYLFSKSSFRFTCAFLKDISFVLGYANPDHFSEQS